MGWNTNAGGGRSGERPAFIQEGNLEIMLFTEEKQRVTFLTQDIDVEQVMSQNQLTREQAMEYIYTEMARTMWINPYDYWSHDVPSITGSRFFSTIACVGRQTCFCCAENDKAKASGITENKMLPYPVKKKYLVPVWVYSMNRVLFIRQNQAFMDSIGEYLNKFGSNSDFDVWKTGKGFSTNNHSMYLGPRGVDFPQTPLQMIMPNQIDFGVTQEEINKKIGVTSAQQQTPPVQQPAQSYQAQPVVQPVQPVQPVQGNGPAPVQTYQVPPGTTVNVQPAQSNAGAFIIPFGMYKGQSLEQAYAQDPATIIFFRDKGNGLVQTKAAEFLTSKGV